MSAPPLELQPVAHVRAPWQQKFGIPRQSQMATATELRVELVEGVPAEVFRGLEQVSHLWLLCWFHATRAEGWRPTVRPPRLGGQKRLGVFATRSPHRPNPIALSLVRLLEVQGRALRVSGGDLLDMTPVLDIKPHLPWAEQPADASCAWAEHAPTQLAVRFSPAAERSLARRADGERLRALLIDSLRWDPRPAAQRKREGRVHALAFAGLDVRFWVSGELLEVLELVELESEDSRQPR